MVSASGIPASNFARGYAVASNRANHELRTVKKWLQELTTYYKCRQQIFQFSFTTWLNSL